MRKQKKTILYESGYESAVSILNLTCQQLNDDYNRFTKDSAQKLTDDQLTEILYKSFDIDSFMAEFTGYDNLPTQLKEKAKAEFKEHLILLQENIKRDSVEACINSNSLSIGLTRRDPAFYFIEVKDQKFQPKKTARADLKELTTYYALGEMAELYEKANNAVKALNEVHSLLKEKLTTNAYSLYDYSKLILMHPDEMKLRQSDFVSYDRTDISLDYKQMIEQFK